MTAVTLGDEHARVDPGSARVRPWGVTVPATVGDERLVFKATEPKRGFEGRLTKFVGARSPVLAPRVLALDDARNWMLMEHHGDVLRDTLTLHEQVSALVSLLRDYAAVQASSIGSVEGWIAAGVPDRRIGSLPNQTEAFLERAALDSDLLARCLARLPTLHKICAELDEWAWADALEHADIHGTNVVTSRGRHVLIDWGDCCITHPFTALFVPIAFVVAALPSGERQGAASRLRDAYLQPWGGATRENLHRLDLATEVAPLVRILALDAEPDGGAEIVSLLGGWASSSLTER